MEEIKRHPFFITIDWNVSEETLIFSFFFAKFGSLTSVFIRKVK